MNHPRRWSPSWVAAVVVIVMSGAAACPSLPSFGRRCRDDDDCDDDAPVCVDERCVPARLADDAGKSCSEPVPFVPPETDDPALLLRVASTFGKAGVVEPRPDGVAADARSVVFKLVVREPMGVRFDVSTDAKVVVDVRPLQDTRCGEPVATGPSPLVAPLLSAGEWAVIVHEASPAQNAGRFVLTATRVDCPAGYVPLDDASCVGFRAVAPVPFALRQPSTALIDGRVVVVDAQQEYMDNGARAGVQIFDPTTERWSMVDVPGDIAFAGLGQLPDGDGVAVANTPGGLLTVMRLVARNGFEVATILPVTRGTSSPFSAPPTVVPVQEGVFVAGAGASSFVLEPTVRTCDSVGCPDGSICVTDERFIGGDRRICLCTTSACSDAVPFEQRSIAPDALADRARTIGVTDAARLGLTFVHGYGAADAFGTQPAAFIDSKSATAALVPLAARTDVTLGTARGNVVVVGGLVGGRDGTGEAARTSSLIEFVDPTTGLVETDDLPNPIVHPVVAPLAGGVVVLGGCHDVGCGSPSSSVSFIFREEPERPSPRLTSPVGGSALVALPIDDDHVFIVDGFSRRTVILERVPRGFRGLPLDDSAPCPTTQELSPPLDGQALVIAGAIFGRLDLLRSDSCSSDRAIDEPEAVYAIDLDEPANVTVTLTSGTTDPQYSFHVWAFVGDCALGRRDLGCSDDTNTTTSLVLDAVPAGRLYVVVEAESPLNSTGEPVPDFTPFSLEITTTPGPVICSADEFDPGDDDALTARPLSTRIDDDGQSTVAEASGQLCAGDIDNLLYVHGGGPLVPTPRGFDLANLQFRLATLDEGRSAAAGRPVLERVDDEPLSTGAGFIEGAYVVSLVAPQDASDPTAVRWSLALRSGCGLEQVDSIVSALDDGARPVGPAPEGRELHTVRSLCFAKDVDVIALPTWFNGERLTIDVLPSGGGALPVAVRRVLPDGTPADGVPVTTAVNSSTTTLTAIASADERVALVLGPTSTEHQTIAVDVVFSGGPGDTCHNALPLQGAAGVEAVTLEGRVNDVNVEDIGDCTGFSSRGPDAFYVLALGNGEGAQITVRPVLDAAGDSDNDISLYAFVGCPPTGNACIVGSDDAGDGGPESLTIAPSPQPRTVFVGVDLFGGEPGELELTWVRTQ